MTALWIALAYLAGVATPIALAWFTRDMFPTIFTPSDWD